MPFFDLQRDSAHDCDAAGMTLKVCDLPLKADFMINMLPETIFYQLVLSCVLMVCVLIIPCIVFSIYYQRKRAPIGFEYEDHIS